MIVFQPSIFRCKLAVSFMVRVDHVAWNEMTDFGASRPQEVDWLFSREKKSGHPWKFQGNLGRGEILFHLARSCFFPAWRIFMCFFSVKSYRMGVWRGMRVKERAPNLPRREHYLVHLKHQWDFTSMVPWAWWSMGGKGMERPWVVFEWLHYSDNMEPKKTGGL